MAVFRSLLKTPAHAFVCVVSLALSIGTLVSSFALLDSLFFRPLPVPRPDELRVLHWSGAKATLGQYRGSLETQEGELRSTGRMVYSGHTAENRITEADSFTFPQFSALRAGVAGDAKLLGYSYLLGTTLRTGAESFVADGLIVSDNFFSGLGVRSQLGRLFASKDGSEPGSPVVVLGERLWKERYGGRNDAVGETVVLNGSAFTIVGVLEASFEGVDPRTPTDFYVPMSAQPLLLRGWSLGSSEHWWIRIMARLGERAQDELLATKLNALFGGLASSSMEKPSVVVSEGRSGPSWSRREYRRPAFLLLAAAATAFGVACANLAGLSLARAEARRAEFALRAALGAGRPRLLAVPMAENLALSAAGCSLGCLLAQLGGFALVQRLFGSFPSAASGPVAFDASVALAATGICLLAAVLTGLAPALLASRTPPWNGLRSGAGGTAGKQRTIRFLIVAQTGLALFLAVLAGLHIRSLHSLLQVDTGFDTDKLLYCEVLPRSVRYTNEQATAYYERARDALANLPGVKAVTLGQFRLLDHTMAGGSFFSLPSAQRDGSEAPSAHRLSVGDGFFETLGIPLLEGRPPGAETTAEADRRIVVNKAFARRYFPDVSPLGKSLGAEGREWRIVGVVGDARFDDLRHAPPPTVYFPFRQDPLGSAYFIVRSSSVPSAVSASVRRTLASVDPSVPIGEMTTQDAIRDADTRTERLFAILGSSMAGYCVLLACVGLYSLMAYRVNRRTREIGVRAALGATPRALMAPIFRDALLLVGAGVAVGLAASLPASRLLCGEIYGIAPGDPLTLSACVLALGLLAGVACWLPARRAARVDPMTALRSE